MKNSCMLPLLLSTLAGLSTVIGALIVFFAKNTNKKLISFALAFASGVMLTISLTDLLPSAQINFVNSKGKINGTFYALFFFLIGVIITMLIDNFLPDSASSSANDKQFSKLYKVGFVTMIALMMHNLPEGITTFISSYQDITLGIYISAAIALHNIPEGISIAMPIYYSTSSKAKAIKYTFLSAIAEPLGALIAFLFLKPYINDLILSVFFALVAGIMTYISIEELLPESRNSGHTFISFGSFILGFLIITISHALL